MAIELLRIRRTADHLIRFQQTESLQVYFIAVTVLFASLGLGEAVYRLSFSDFDGARDRFPIETLCGLALSFLATKLARNVYRHRKQTTARLHLIWDRNHRIRHALAGISPLAHPLKNQQSIRVIHEEVDHIESVLKEVLPVR
jgi:hypothetical protein